MFQADFGSFSVMIYASVKVGIEFALKHWTISSRTHKTLAGAPACASNHGRKKMQRCLARNLHKHCFCLKITYPEIHEPHQLNHIIFFLKLNCLWVHTTFSCLTAILLALPAMNKNVRALSSKTMVLLDHVSLSWPSLEFGTSTQLWPRIVTVNIHQFNCGLVQVFLTGQTMIRDQWQALTNHLSTIFGFVPIMVNMDEPLGSGQTGRRLKKKTALRRLLLQCPSTGARPRPPSSFVKRLSLK